MSSSRFFQRFDPAHPNNAEFVHYARQLQDLHDEDITPIMEALDEFLGGRENTQAESASHLAQALKRSPALTASLLRALEEFLRHFTEAGADEAEARAVAADLRATGIIKSSDEPTIAALMIRLATIAPSILLKIEASDTKTWYFPVFVDVQTTAELRAVFPNELSTEPGTTVAIASIHIELDRDPDALFQIDRPSLEVFIAKLQHTSERLRRFEEMAKNLNTSVPDVAQIA